MSRNAAIISVILLCSLSAFSQATLTNVSPPITAPPEAFFNKVRASDRDVARQFYTKYLDISGLPVAAASVVADQALQRTWDLVTHLLAGRPDVKAAMVSNGMYLIIIGKDQLYTDMPEYRHHPNPAYQNERVRGTGGLPTSFGEENLLSLPVDRYDDESIGLHEFCHTIDATLRSIDPTWIGRRNSTYRHATELGLWTNTYAGSNPGEYWAETCQCYFHCARINNWNHGPIGTREQLKQHDPQVYELIRDTFKLSPDQDWHYTWLRPLPNVSAPPAKFKIPPYYTKFTWAREFTVIGRQVADQALLKANDTIRKLFAYRHDILKALIADGVKLVVLGRHERLGALPEFQQWKTSHPNLDPQARTLDYLPETKLLVVPEENLLGNANQLSEECLLIRQFAKALFQVTGQRPVDPNWEHRGREVQQYELRVKRLDVRFGQQVQQLFATAKAKGLWNGTKALNDPGDYWAEGMLAYFDAIPRSASAKNSAHPAATREALKNYDPDLYALVNETMAYEGHTDWRYSPP